MNSLNLTKRSCLLIVLIVLGVGLVAICAVGALGIGLYTGTGSNRTGVNRSGLRLGWTEVTGLDRKRCTYARFTGREYLRFRADAGETVELDYEVEVKRGALRIRLEDPDGAQIWQTYLQEDEVSSFEFTADQSGLYTVVVIGDGTRGSFEIEW